MKFYMLLENGEIQETEAVNILSCVNSVQIAKAQDVPVLAVANSEKAIKEIKKILMSKDEYKITGQTESRKAYTSSPVSPGLPVSKTAR